MGNSVAEVPPKSEKMSSPVQTQEQPATHPYPDWAAMQAYYGPGLVPPPYFATAVAPGHAPHPYMWGPQPMVPPFGSPYTAIYPHGVYPHPAVPLGSHTHCQGVAPLATASEAVMMATPLSMEMTKSSGNREKLPTKRLRAANGLSTGNCTTESTGGVDSNAHSQSGYNSAEGSSDGSDGNNAVEVAEGQRKRRSKDIPRSDSCKADTQVNSVHAEEASSGMPLGVTAAPSNIVGKQVGTGQLACPPPTMEARVANTGKVKGTPVSPISGGTVPARNGVSPEHWMQDERELKRERRKQSNRESARRSRLRKQAETEELATKVEALNAENTTLRSEIRRLTENSEKLRLQNIALVEKLRSVQTSQAGELSLGIMETDEVPSAIVRNLSTMDNPSSINRNNPKEDENKEKPTAKLHQLLDNNPRRDAIAAS